MIKLYEHFIEEDVKLYVSGDLFTYKLIREIYTLKDIKLHEDETLVNKNDSAADTTDTTNAVNKTDATNTVDKTNNTDTADTVNKTNNKNNVIFIAKMLKPIVSFITKHNPAKYIMLFATKGIEGIASLFPEKSKIREVLIKVYEKIEASMQKLFELPHEPGKKAIDIGGYRVDRSKIVGFVIAAFSLTVVIGAILRKVDELRSKNASTVESVISVKEYMLSESSVAVVKNPLTLTSTMIKKYGETTTLLSSVKDETKKTIIKIIATIIAAAVALLVFYLFNCLFFKLFLRIDSLIKRTTYEEYVKMVQTFLSRHENAHISGMKGIGIFTNMYITLCNIFGETLKISMFRKEDLNNTLLACIGGRVVK